MQRAFFLAVLLIIGCGDSNNVGRQDTCTPPESPLACQQTQDCGNYPSTVCGQTGFCICPSAVPDAGGPNGSCTPPQPPLACQQTHDCANYPSTVCGQDGFCICSSTDAGVQQTADAGGPNGSCTPPQPPLACQQTHDCANYPSTVCGQTGFCVCP
jgi:hypothetical protein